MAWKSAWTKNNLVNSIEPIPSTNKWLHGKVLEEVVQFKYLVHPNERRSSNKGSEDQTGATTLSHDKASNTMEKNVISFPTKITVYQLLVL